MNYESDNGTTNGEEDGQRSSLNIPVPVRSHELRQLDTQLPRIRDVFDAADRDEDAADVDEIYTEYIEPLSVEPRENDEFCAYVSMPAAEWRDTISHLNRARWSEPTRIHWLQTKLTDRLNDRVEEFTN